MAYRVDVASLERDLRKEGSQLFLLARWKGVRITLPGWPMYLKSLCMYVTFQCRPMCF